MVWKGGRRAEKDPWADFEARPKIDASLQNRRDAQNAGFSRVLLILRDSSLQFRSPGRMVGDGRALNAAASASEMRFTDFRCTGCIVESHTISDAACASQMRLVNF